MDSGQNADGGNAGGGGVFLWFGSGAGVSDGVGATSGISGNVGQPGTGVFDNGLTSKKTRPGLVIGIVVVMLAVAAIVTALIFGMRSVQKNDAKFKDNFYQLANYVLYGEDSTVPIDDAYSDSFEYYFMTQQEIEEEQSVLYEKTGELLSRLETDNVKISEWVDEERRLLSFMEAVYTKPILTPFDIEDRYTEKASLAKGELLNYYGVSMSEDNEYMQRFLENFTVWVDAKIEELEIYDKNGCLGDEMPDLYCLGQIIDEETLSKLEENEEILRSAYGSYQRGFNLARNFVANVFWINTLVEAENE